MKLLLMMFCILVVFILYLLRRYVGGIEGFEDGSATPNIFDKVSMCPILAKQINIHAEEQSGLADEKAVDTLSSNNTMMDAYQKKYDELGCANVQPPPT